MIAQVILSVAVELPAKSAGGEEAYDKEVGNDPD